MHLKKKVSIFVKNKTMAKRFESKEEALEYIKTLSMAEIVDLAASALLENTAAGKIIITQEQFQNYFKIRGLNANGEPETRGRRPKEG